MVGPASLKLPPTLKLRRTGRRTGVAFSFAPLRGATEDKSEDE